MPGSDKPSQYWLQSEYVAHIITIMELVSNTLNEFLRATKSPRMFSFGSSAYYGNHSFEELVNSDWPSQAIVSQSQMVTHHANTSHTNSYNTIPL